MRQPRPSGRRRVGSGNTPRGCSREAESPFRVSDTEYEETTRQARRLSRCHGRFLPAPHQGTTGRRLDPTCVGSRVGQRRAMLAHPSQCEDRARVVPAPSAHRTQNSLSWQVLAQQATSTLAPQPAQAYAGAPRRQRAIQHWLSTRTCTRPSARARATTSSISICRSYGLRAGTGNR